VAIGVLVVVAVGVLTLVRIPVNLNNYRGTVESAASSALGRAVSVDGNITVTTSLWPYFEIQSLRIANPAGFEDGDLAPRMELARVSIALFGLLSGDLKIGELRVEAVALNLVRNADGDINWALGGASDPGPVKADADTVEDASEPRGGAIALDVLELSDISVTYSDARDGETMTVCCWSILSTWRSAPTRSASSCQ
jgi:uncharacterized protein involved in outer membrane biogenesis